MIKRDRHVSQLEGLLRNNPVVALLGARQVGKTTLARMITKRRSRVTSFDLEDPTDVARLTDPMLALRPLRGLVVIDEVQRRPDLFEVLRVLADRPKTPARFLLLGSASPDLGRSSSETLAGRIAFHELHGLSLEEVGSDNWKRLWLRGGFPRSYTARSVAQSGQWRRDFIRTFLERDVPSFGIRVPATTLRRFWTMLAHYHAQTWNGSELGRAFGVADTTVRHYLDILTETFVVRQLQPWHENLSKRQVRAPKIYLADSGLVHTLLGIQTQHELEGHPKVGASWEGFALDAVMDARKIRPEDAYFWAAHAGAEIDLIAMGRRRVGFEFKRTSAPKVTRSMHTALEDLGLDRLEIVYPGHDVFELAPRIRAVGITALGQSD